MEFRKYCKVWENMKEYASGNLYLGDIYKPLTEVVMDAKCAKAIMMEIKECRGITSRELEILSYLGSSWKWSLIDAKHYFRDFCQGQHDVYDRLDEFVLQENLSPIYTAYLEDVVIPAMQAKETN